LKEIKGRFDGMGLLFGGFKKEEAVVREEQVGNTRGSSCHF
jgi:hypothetical protein